MTKGNSKSNGMSIEPLIQKKPTVRKGKKTSDDITSPGRPRAKKTTK